MSSKNDITGDKLISKASTQNSLPTYYKIFIKNKEVENERLGPMENESK